MAVSEFPKTGPLYLALLGLVGKEEVVVAMDTLRQCDWDSSASSDLSLIRLPRIYTDQPRVVGPFFY